MSSGLSRVLPEALRGIELRRVRWQLVHLKPAAVGGEPFPYLGILVVRSVVLNQNRPRAAIGARQLLQKAQVGVRVEDRLLPVMETRAPQFDGSQDLDALPLAGDRDFRRVPDATPGGMQRGVLSETGFIGEDQRPTLGSGFFLRLGYVRRCQRSCAAASARARTRRGRCTEKPIWCSSFRTCPGW